MSSKISVLGINGGNGVILYPFLKSKRFKIIGNIEARGAFSTPKNIQWILNFGDIPFVKNLDAMPLRGLSPDVVIGAPDCGHSSILSYSKAKKMSDAKQNKSLDLFIQGIDLFKPKVFLMENLEALLKNYGEEALEKALGNYNLKYLSAPVSYYGNSQIHRKRLMIVGLRKDLPKKWLNLFVLPEFDSSKLRLSGELIHDLIKKYPDPKLCHMRESDDTLITLYAGFKDKVGNIKRKWVNELTWDKRWPVENRNFTSAPGVYRNLESDYPATARKQNRQYNHLGEMMSPRELARIQGIPDSFKIVFLPQNAQYWINKGRVTVTKTPPIEMIAYFKPLLYKLSKKWKLKSPKIS